jgi:hypothetical protein
MWLLDIDLGDLGPAPLDLGHGDDEDTILHLGRNGLSIYFLATLFLKVHEVVIAYAVLIVTSTRLVRPPTAPAAGLLCRLGGRELDDALKIADLALWRGWQQGGEEGLVAGAVDDAGDAELGRIVVPIYSDIWLLGARESEMQDVAGGGGEEVERGGEGLGAFVGGFGLGVGGGGEEEVLEAMCPGRDIGAGLVLGRRAAGRVGRRAARAVGAVVAVVARTVRVRAAAVRRRSRREGEGEGGTGVGVVEGVGARGGGAGAIRLVVQLIGCRDVRVGGDAGLGRGVVVRGALAGIRGAGGSTTSASARSVGTAVTVAVTPATTSPGAGTASPGTAAEGAAVLEQMGPGFLGVGGEAAEGASSGRCTVNTGARGGGTAPDGVILPATEVAGSVVSSRPRHVL